MAEEAKKILIAEDDKFLLKIYLTKLEAAGYVIVSAEDGDTALEKLKTELPNLLILDILLPKKNGFEVLLAMKADPAIKHIPVIVLSNLGQELDVEKAMSAGAIDYLVKANVSIESVLEKIKSHI
ncbi:response regulator [Candidatus Gracilibacteria bacterium]|nr:response regulator [Candidatus Gracilibacteria bacterium]